MGTIRNTIVEETRIYDDPKNPNNSPYDMLVPRTTPEAVIDSRTNTPLSDKIKKYDESLNDIEGATEAANSAASNANRAASAANLAAENAVRGSRWNVGTAVTGTSTSGVSFSTGLSDSLVGDMYLNSTTSDVYRCVASGDATSAKWSWVGNIQGQQGDRGWDGHGIFYTYEKSNGGYTTTLQIDRIQNPSVNLLYEGDFVITDSAEFYQITSVVSSGGYLAVNYMFSLKATGGNGGAVGVGVFYGTCDTKSDDQNKVVDLVDGTEFSLVEGTVVIVKFTYAHSLPYLSLNVNRKGYAMVTGDLTNGNTIRAGNIYSFVYRSDAWCLIGRNTDKVYYCKCDTTASTKEKAVQLWGRNNALNSYEEDGIIAVIYFTNGNSSSEMTFKFTGDGTSVPASQSPKSVVMYGGVNIPSDYIKAESVHAFVNFGDKWILLGAYPTPTIKAAAGNYINSVGTPTVTASTSGAETTFTFNYLKGATGAPGTNGVTPTIKAAAGNNINSVGTPTVTASTSGTETTFTFNYLKGATGATGTVDTSTLNSKMNTANPTGTGSFSLNRKSGTAIGNYSFTEGIDTTASGTASHAQGSGTAAGANYSFSGGVGSSVSAGAAAALAFGENAKANGYVSISVGGGTTTSNSYAAAFGADTTASAAYGVAFGKYNNDGGGAATHLFTIGYGTSKTSPINAFRVSSDGSLYSPKGSITAGQDYAEYIKPWFDDNIDNEDRRGYFVTIRNGKLYKAEPGDYIVGITSGNPSVIGGGDEDWLGRWKRDEFNELIYEEIEVDDYQIQPDEDGNTERVKVGSHTEKHTVQVENYDPTQKYIERKDRPEWSCVGMIGVIPLRDDGTCIPGGFAKCRGYGIATRADEYRCHETFFVIERINDHIVSVEMR